MTDEAPTTRVIEFEQSGSKLRVTVNADDRVTYGQVAPGQRSGGGYALRIYRGSSKDITRAVFSDVTNFRETDMPIQRLAVRRFGSEEWHVDDGSYTGARAETVQKDWVDEDKINPSPPPVDEDELDLALTPAPHSLGYPVAQNYPVRKR